MLKVHTQACRSGQAKAMEVAGIWRMAHAYAPYAGSAFAVQVRVIVSLFKPPLKNVQKEYHSLLLGERLRPSMLIKLVLRHRPIQIPIAHRPFSNAKA